jgi:hypothetical protein
MRLARANPTATREGRIEQLRRDRASAPTLRATFPTIDQLRIELKFAGPSANTPATQLHLLYPPARAFFGYPCPYSDCDGHFDLGDAIKGALAHKSNVSTGVLECGGLRARDYASKQPCLLQIHYEVTATYHKKT